MLGLKLNYVSKSGHWNKFIMEKVNCLLSYSPRNHFTKGFMSPSFKSWQNWCCPYLKNDHLIRSQFCTCHNSSAVKLWPDWIIKIKLRCKNNFHKFSVMSPEIFWECSLHWQWVTTVSLVLNRHQDIIYKKIIKKEITTSSISLAAYGVTRPQWVNSLAPGKFENNFQNVFFKLISWIDTLSNSCETVLRRMPQNPSDDKSTLV